jgi:hypothetical protein
MIKKAKLTALLVTVAATAIITLAAPTANAARSTQPARPCSTEPGMASSTFDTTTTITFVNATSAPVDVYWLDYSGQRVLYYPGLAPGASYVQETYASHPWVVTDASNACLAVFMGVGHPTTATTR